MMVAFQSRFGREEWLKPYLQDSVEALPAKGIKNLAIICPCFSSDCVETLEEINIGIRETFAEAGGENFTYIPCLNDTEDGMKVIEALVTRELMGWVQAWRICLTAFTKFAVLQSITAPVDRYFRRIIGELSQVSSGIRALKMVVALQQLNPKDAFTISTGEAIIMYLRPSKPG